MKVDSSGSKKESKEDESIGILSESEQEKMKTFVKSETDYNERILDTFNYLENTPKTKKGKKERLGDDVFENLRNIMIEDAMDIKREQISDVLSIIYHRTSKVIDNISDFCASYYIGMKSKFIYVLLKYSMTLIWVVLYGIIWVLSTLVARMSCYWYLRLFKFKRK